MTRESIDAKSRRYLGEGRLVVTHVLGDQVAAVCQGDTGTYDLGYQPGCGWWCSCPVRTDRCSHLAALWLVAIRRRGAPTTSSMTESTTRLVTESHHLVHSREDGNMTAEKGFAVGQTVRWDAELIRSWYGDRAADGAGHAQGAQIGRIAKIIQDGYCGTCDNDGHDCPGPWYAVDFGDGPSSGFGGSYAGHELEAA